MVSDEKCFVVVWLYKVGDLVVLFRQNVIKDVDYFCTQYGNNNKTLEILLQILK